MISLSGYFDYKEDIKTILVIAEHDNTCDLLLKLCTIKHDLKKLYLAGNSKKRLAKMVSVLKRTAEQNSSFHLPHTFCDGLSTETVVFLRFSCRCHGCPSWIHSVCPSA